MSDVRSYDLATPSEAAPVVIDRYELLVRNWVDPLAASWIARTRDRRLVELVHVGDCVARRPELREAFLGEVTALRGTAHISFHGFQSAGYVNGALYGARPHLETVTLEEALSASLSAGEKVPPAVLVRIALEALAALKAIHQVSTRSGLMIHGDIVPSQVLLSAEGSVFLAHSGLAAAASKFLLAAPARNPRLAYKAPEQLDERSLVDARADVFALGVLLWEAIARRALFDGDGDADVAERVRTLPVPPLSAGALPPGFASAIARALQRDPAQRFASAAEFKETLRVVPTIASASELGKWVVRHGMTKVSQRRDALAERGARVATSTPPPPSERPPEEPQLGPTYVAPTEVPKYRTPMFSQPEAKVVLNLPAEGEAVREEAVLAARARRRASTVKMKGVTDEILREALGRPNAPPLPPRPPVGAPAAAPPAPRPISVPPAPSAANSAPAIVQASPDDGDRPTLHLAPSPAKRVAVVFAVAAVIGAVAIVGRAVVRPAASIAPAASTYAPAATPSVDPTPDTAAIPVGTTVAGATPAASAPAAAATVEVDDAHAVSPGAAAPGAAAPKRAAPPAAAPTPAPAPAPTHPAARPTGAPAKPAKSRASDIPTEI